MLNSILANVIAGLGLFFSGLRMVDANLRQATGRQLRTFIGRITGRPWLAAIVGLVTGALVQSSSGIVFILVSLVTSGLTTVRRVLPVVAWANVGCCALVFVAVLDLRLAILYLVGVAGAAFAFNRSHRSDALGAVFGIGMLFYGIDLMKTGAEPLQEMPWFAVLLDGSGQSLALALAGGTAVSFLTQSSAAVSILVIGFAQTGVIGPYPTMMAIYGANLGSTLSRIVLSSTLRGSVRQLTAYQDVFKVTGTVLFVALLYLESVLDVPLVLAFVRQVAGRIDRQMALVCLLFNLVMAVLVTALQPAIIRLLERWLPADMDEDLARPLYLYDEALSEPSTALDLIAKEHTRLARRLLAYPEAMRTPVGSEERVRLRTAHEAFTAVTDRVEQFQHELVNQQTGPAETERLTRLQNRLALLTYLEDSLCALVSAAQAVDAGSAIGRRVSMLVEALDFVLLSLVDAIETGDPEQVELIQTVTGDRGDFVERVRQGYLAEESGGAGSDRVVLLTVTNAFERIIWMTQRFARLLETVPAGERPISVVNAQGGPPGTPALG